LERMIEVAKAIYGQQGRELLSRVVILFADILVLNDQELAIGWDLKPRLLRNDLRWAGNRVGATMSLLIPHHRLDRRGLLRVGEEASLIDQCSDHCAVEFRVNENVSVRR